MACIDKRLKADARDMRIAVSMAAQQSYRDSRLGKFGAASPVRRIDPATGQVLPEVSVQSSQTATNETKRQPFKGWRRRGYWNKQFAAKMADEKA